MKRIWRLALTALILAATVLPILPAQVARAADFSAWTNWRVIVFDFANATQNRQTSDNLTETANWTNFPTRIELNSSNWDFSKAREDGNDIRFPDSGNATGLPFHKESYNGTQEHGIFWVSNNVTPWSNNQFIYIASGNPAATTDTSTTWVFQQDPHLKAIWLLNEKSGVTAADLSGNGNTGNLSGGVTWSTYGNDGATFDGATGLINVSPSSSLNNIVNLTTTAKVRRVGGGELNSGRIWDKGNKIFYNTEPSPSFLQGFSVAYGRWTPTTLYGDWAQGANVTIAATYVDNATANIPYWVINGLATTGSVNNAPNGVKSSDAGSLLTIGNDSSGAVTWNGVIDDLVIWDEVKDISYLRAWHQMYDGSLITVRSASPLATLTTNAATGISMTRDGVVSGTFNGSMSYLGSQLHGEAWFQWGTDLNYGTNTTRQSSGLATANFSFSDYPVNIGQLMAAADSDGDMLGVFTGVDGLSKAVSYDGGKTWQNASLVVPHGANYTSIYGVVVAFGDNISLFYSRYYALGDADIYETSTTNLGQTWSPDRLIETGYTYSLTTPNTNPIVMRSGRGIIPVTTSTSGQPAVLYTTNNGTTWTIGGIVAAGGVYLDEPSPYENDDGSLRMLMRTDTGFLYSSNSTDGGVTWSSRVATTIVAPNAPFTAVRRSFSPSEVLLARNTHGSGASPPRRYPLVIERSFDSGVTWEDSVQLANNGDLALPTNYRNDHPSIFVSSDNDTAVISWLNYSTTGILNSNPLSRWRYVTLDYLFGDKSISNPITDTIPSTLTPGQTYYYRIAAQTSGGYSSGSDQSIALTMPTPVTGTSAVSGGSQITFNGNVSNLGVATSYYRFIEYWGQDGVHYTTPETIGTATGTYSASVEGVSTIGGVNYRAGVRVGAVYSYGATLSTTSPYNGTSAVIFVTPIIIWIALLVAFVIFLTQGYQRMRQGDNGGANAFWALAMIMIAIDAVLFIIVWEAIKGVTGG